jgi:hypothetical protein
VEIGVRRGRRPSRPKTNERVLRIASGPVCRGVIGVPWGPWGVRSVYRTWETYQWVTTPNFITTYFFWFFGRFLSKKMFRGVFAQGGSSHRFTPLRVIIGRMERGEAEGRAARKKIWGCRVSRASESVSQGLGGLRGPGGGGPIDPTKCFETSKEDAGTASRPKAEMRKKKYLTSPRRVPGSGSGGQGERGGPGVFRHRSTSSHPLLLQFDAQPSIYSVRKRPAPIP